MSDSTAAAADGSKQQSPLSAYTPPSLESFEASLRLAPGHAPLTPVSSPQDARQYRVLTLANGLTALLVSDPTTEKAAASLDVNVGSFAEPDELLGLAHFLEHMLFMGTEKYPEEASYSQVINNYGGSQNAYTTREHTNYIFDVAKDHLEDILDRFAQFFISPLCLKSAVDRELLAVNNEHEKNTQQDVWRISEVASSTLNPAHPVSRFSTGNFETLRDDPRAKGIDTRDSLLDWYKRHYSSNLMKLCVVGAQGLDELERMVRACFADVPNRGVERPSFLHIPVATPEQCATLTHIVPVKSSYRSLEVEFILPPTHHLYLSDPVRLLSYVLSHEAEGSLAHVLKQRGWINALHSGHHEQNTSYALASLDLDLTEVGLKEHVPEILEIVFSYLALIRDSLEREPERWRKGLYEEVAAMVRADFRFKAKIDPIWLAEELANKLSYIPAQHVLSGGEMAEYDHASLLDLARRMADVRQTRVRVVAPEYASLEGMQTDKFYGTRFIVEKMDESLLARLSNPPTVPELHLPKPNPFIATEFELKHPQHSEADIASGAAKNPDPVHILVPAPEGSILPLGDGSIPSAEAAGAHLYWAPDQTFHLPKGDLSVQFANGLVGSSAAAKVSAQLWSDLVDDVVAETVHYASEGGLEAYSWPSSAGLNLRYQGYNQRLATLLDTLLPQIRAVRAVEHRSTFDRLKEQLVRKLSSYPRELPTVHARDDLNAARFDVFHSPADQLAALSGLTPEILDAFVDQWLSEGRLYVLAAGNLTQEEAVRLTNQVQKAFPMRPLGLAREYVPRCVTLPAEVASIRAQANHSDEQPNSCSINSYQIGVVNEKDEAHVKLIEHMLGDAAFDQLRTKEGLGYMVHVQSGLVAGVLHLQLAIMSSDAGASYLSHRAEAFLAWWRREQFDALVKETPDFLDQNKRAVSLLLTERDKNIGEWSSRLWSEIERRRFDWNRRERVAAAVESVSVESMWAFWDRFLAFDSKERRKCSVQYTRRSLPLPSSDQRVQRDSDESVQFANAKLAVKKASAEQEAALQAMRLPTVPVDPRDIRYVDDIAQFKRGCPAYPAML